MTQNTSSAVMQQRTEPDDSLDDFPTPAWATRAVIETILGPAQGLLGLRDLRRLRVAEPCANRGYMARPLAEYFASVRASDVHDYGLPDCEIHDYLFPGRLSAAEWTFMNPPFKLALEFIERSFETPEWRGTAAIVRTSFLEGNDRYHRLFKINPPTIVAQHAERVIMTRGIVRDPSKLYWDEVAQKHRRPSTATSYCWLIWMRDRLRQPMTWIPPCRLKMERPGDYDLIGGQDEDSV